MELATKKSDRLLSDLNTTIDQFLCRVLRGEMTRWSALDKRISSEDFLSRCQHHGVQALLYHQAQGRGEWIEWPDDIRRALEQQSKAGTAQEMLRSYYLSKLLGKFSEHEVRCLLLKGEALAYTHYLIPGTRARGDSDLFIHIDDVFIAQSLVDEMGLHIVSPKLRTHQFTVMQSESAVGAFVFDVHWRMLNNPRYARLMSFDEVYDRSVVVPDLYCTRVPCTADALLLACMHRLGSKNHDRDRLIWIYDIHLLISSMTTAEQTEFAAKAVELDVQEECMDGIVRSCTWFCTRVAAEALELLKAPGQQQNLSTRFNRSNLALLLDDAQRLPDLQSRKLLLCELVLPPATFLEMKYGKSGRWWWPVLYTRHIIEGFLKRLTLR